jgi:hypothetical protein
MRSSGARGDAGGAAPPAVERPSQAVRRPQTNWSDPDRVLRRLQWLAGGYGAAGALWLLLVRRAAVAAVVLTLAAAASIVAFRGLQGLVGQLAAGEPDTRRPTDRRSRRLVWLRFSLLALAPLASLWMDSERALALIMGFSVLPLAAVTEGLLQLGWALTDRDHGG